MSAKYQYLKALFLRHSVLYQPSTGFNDQNADSRDGIDNKWLPKVFQIKDQCSQGWSRISKQYKLRSQSLG